MSRGSELRLEMARSGVGRRRLGLLCWTPVGLQILACAGRSIEASTGRASPGFSCVDLLSLLVSVATKLCQAYPVVRVLADITNIHVRVGGFRIYRLQASGAVAYLTTCTFNVGAGSSADACWLKASILEERQDPLFYYHGPILCHTRCGTASVGEDFEVVLALPVHPGIVVAGLGVRWKIGPSLNARGSHAVCVELFRNTSYFARVRFHFACGGVCECLGLRRSISCAGLGGQLPTVADGVKRCLRQGWWALFLRRRICGQRGWPYGDWEIADPPDSEVFGGCRFNFGGAHLQSHFKVLFDRIDNFVGNVYTASLAGRPQMRSK
eukprot:1157094-Pelagomonas_calceolata.AAC.3